MPTGRPDQLLLSNTHAPDADRCVPLGDVHAPAGTRQRGPELHRSILGKRLVGIEKMSIEEAFAAVRSTIGADNDMEYLYTVPFELPRPELLHALGVTASPERAKFVFEGDVRVTFHAIPLKSWRKLEWATVSTEILERYPALGDADRLPVDLPAANSFEMYRQARDPVLEAALAAKIAGPGASR